MGKIWFCKNLGDAMMAYLALEPFEAVCRSTCAKANFPDDMAVFLRHESEGRLHCEVKLYLSPPLALTAKELGAIPCERPTKQGLSLLVGTPDAWSVLFPEG